MVGFCFNSSFNSVEQSISINAHIISEVRNVIFV